MDDLRSRVQVKPWRKAYGDSFDLSFFVNRFLVNKTWVTNATGWLGPMLSAFDARSFEVSLNCLWRQREQQGDCGAAQELSPGQSGRLLGCLRELLVSFSLLFPMALYVLWHRLVSQTISEISEM